MDKMSYQKARYIRSHSLSDLLAGELSSGEGVGKSIKKVIGLKTKAKITGIKEKLDPLNIIKGLTFGSNLAPALLGRLLGRSQKDIENFAGKSRLVGNKATKIGKAPGEESSGLTETLQKIYSFMKSSQEHDTLMREKVNNFKEEKALEDEKRHKELLKALGAVGSSATAVKNKKSGGGLFDGIFKAFEEFLKKLNTLKDEFLNFKNEFMNFKKILGNAKFLMESLGGAAEFGASVVASIPGLAALLFLAPWVVSAAERDKIKENPYAPEYKDNPLAMKLRGEASSEGAAAKINTAKSVKQIPRNQVKDFIDSDLTDTELKEELGQDREGLKKWLVDNPTIVMYQPPSKRPIKASTDEQAQKSRSTFATQDPRRSDLPDDKVTSSTTDENPSEVSKPLTTTTNPTSSTSLITPNTPASLVSPTSSPSVAPVAPTSQVPSATPVAPTPSSSSVTSSSIENQSLQLQSKTSSTPSTTTNNIVNSSSSKPQNNTVGMSIPAVRNTEDTLRRLFVDSTRLV